MAVSVLFLLSFVHLTRSVNVTLIDMSEEVRLMTSVVVKYLAENPTCALVLVEESERDNGLNAIVTIAHREYQPFLTTLMSSFDNHLLKNQAMYSFTSMPYALRSRNQINFPCALNILVPQSSSSLTKLVVHLSTFIHVRNLHDPFFFWMPPDSNPEEMLQTTLSGIRLKMMATYSSTHQKLELYGVCFFCDSGYDHVILIGVVQDTQSWTYSLPDTSSNLNKRRLTMGYYQFIPLESAREKKRLNGPLALNFYERMSLEMESKLNATFTSRMLYDYGFDAEKQLPDGSWSASGGIGATLSGAINFTLFAMPTENSLRNLDASHPLIFIHAIFATHKPRPYFTWKILLYPYTWHMWVLLLVSNLVSAFLMRFLCRNEHYSFVHSLAFLGRVIIEQPVLGPRVASFRMFLSFFWLFSIIMCCGYKTKLVAFITSPPKEDVPNDIWELIQSNFKWGLPFIQYVAFQASVEYIDTPVYRAIYNKSVMQDSTEVCLQQAMDHNFACIIDNVYFKKAKYLFDNYIGESKLSLSTEGYFNFYAGPAFGRGEVYAPYMQSVLKYMFEAGLINKWLADEELMAQIAGLTGLRQNLEVLFQGKAYTFNDLHAAFLLLHLGAVVSTFVWFLERCWRHREVRKEQFVYVFVK